MSETRQVARIVLILFRVQFGSIIFIKNGNKKGKDFHFL